jgi:beta-glucosidase-like glycosyl hydrolase
VYKFLKTSIDHGVFDNNITGKADANVTTEVNKDISQKLAEAGIVLLKNDESALPLRKPSLGTNNILVIGNAAHHGLTHFNGTAMA